MPKKRPVTERQREAARETAKRLMAEGRWGGSVGRKHVINNNGGKRYSRAVPKARELLEVLDCFERETGVRTGDLRDLFERSGAHQRVDREHVVDLLRRVYNDELASGALSPQVYVDRFGNVDAVPRGRARTRPPTPGELALKLWRAEVQDFETWRDDEVLAGLCFLSNLALYHTPAARDARAFLTTLVSQTKVLIMTMLQERGVNLKPEELPPLEPLAPQVEGSLEATGDLLGGSR